jgi:hypothetical protein
MNMEVEKNPSLRLFKDLMDITKSVFSSAFGMKNVRLALQFLELLKIIFISNFCNEFTYLRKVTIFEKLFTNLVQTSSSSLEVKWKNGFAMNRLINHGVLKTYLFVSTA